MVSVASEVRKTEKSNLVLLCTVKPSVQGGKVVIEWLTARDNQPVDTGAKNVWIKRDAYSANLTIQELLTTDSGAYRFDIFPTSLTFCDCTLYFKNVFYIQFESCNSYVKKYDNVI